MCGYTTSSSIESDPSYQAYSRRKRYTCQKAPATSLQIFIKHGIKPTRRYNIAPAAEQN